MLVVTRRNDEGITIEVDGKSIHVKIFAISRDQSVKVGIEAPKDVIIMRDELLKDTTQSNYRAAQSTQEVAHAIGRSATATAYPKRHSTNDYAAR